MKHTISITAILLIIFVGAQLIGLIIVSEHIDIKASSEAGKTVNREEVNEITGITPPEIENESLSFIPIVAAVAIGTLLVLLIIKFNKGGIWKAWFLLSVVITLWKAFAPFIGKVMALPAAKYAALLLAIGLAIWKIYKPNPYVHNLTELFMYGGIAAIFVPILNLWSVLILLGLISAYDMWAVWKSKHMVTMAKFQTESKIFAGFLIPYKPEKHVAVSRPKSDSRPAITTQKTAILGGGDVAFPLLFTGVMLKITASFIPALIIVITTTIALAILFYKGQKDTFYPAMPFITMGCLSGFLIAWGILYGFSIDWILTAFSFG
jgi:presenilin-like A22 family membrane protease